MIFEKKRFVLSISILLLLLNTCAQGESSGAVRAESYMPLGEYYESEVPATLDLAERGALMVYGLTHFLNPHQKYGPYTHGFFNVDPPYLTNEFGPGQLCWGKIAEGIHFGRLMSGSRDYQDLQQKTIEGMIDFLQRDSDSEELVWMGNTASMATKGRILIALMSMNKQASNPELQALIDKVFNQLDKEVTREGDMAWFYDGPARDDISILGVNNYGWNVYMNGTALRTISIYYDRSGDQRFLKLAEQLKNYLMQPKFWKPEASPKVFVTEDHGWFSGHHHSYCCGLMGLLRYAAVSRDVRLMQFVREGYEYLRNMGLSRIGLFGESCTVGDMTYLAVNLSKLGVGDYWEDVDRYARNQLVEAQITDAEKLRKAAKASAIHKDRFSGHTGPGQFKQEKPFNPESDSREDVVNRCLGVFLSSSSHPTHIPKHQLLWTICCSGNCPHGIYHVWKNIVEFENGAARVNLLLNRASPWMDVDSWLPYEGKVVLHNKKAESASVRIPLWVDKDAVKCKVGDKSVTPFWAGRYLILTSIKPGDVITIQFPMVETTETYSLKWKHADFWKEATDPGHDWVAPEVPDKFTLHLKGNTLIDIEPRIENGEYTFYQRQEMKATKAPMKRVTRFATAVDLGW